MLQLKFSYQGVFSLKIHVSKSILKTIFEKMQRCKKCSVVGHDRVTVMTQILNWVMTETGHDRPGS